MQLRIRIWQRREILGLHFFFQSAIVPLIGSVILQRCTTLSQPSLIFQLYGANFLYLFVQVSSIQVDDENRVEKRLTTKCYERDAPMAGGNWKQLVRKPDRAALRPDCVSVTVCRDKCAVCVSQIERWMNRSTDRLLEFWTKPSKTLLKICVSIFCSCMSSWARSLRSLPCGTAEIHVFTLKTRFMGTIEILFISRLSRNTPIVHSHQVICDVKQ